MRPTIFLVAIALLIGGCSKKFSYHDAYKFDRQFHTARAIESSSPEPGAAADLPLFTASLENSAPATHLSELTQTVRVSRKFKSFSTQTTKLTDSDTVVNSSQPAKRPPLKGREKAAVAGLVITVISYFLAFLGPWLLLFVVVPGMILCIRGLKSEKKIVAIIGLALNIFISIGLLIAIGMRASTWIVE